MERNVPRIPASLARASTVVPITVRRVAVTIPVVVLRTIVVPITTAVSLVPASTAVQATERHAPPTTSVAAQPAAALPRAHAPATSVAGTTWPSM